MIILRWHVFHCFHIIGSETEHVRTHNDLRMEVLRVDKKVCCQCPKESIERDLWWAGEESYNGRHPPYTS